MINAIGLAGALLFALSALPQALKCWNDGHARGMSHGLLWLWFSGEVCMIIYTVGALNSDALLMINYCLNFVLLSVIIKFKYWPRSARPKNVISIRKAH